MRESWLISVLTHLAICVVPMLLMSRVLFLDQDSHLANPGQLPKVSTITDLDGAARMAYLLSDMSAPWANTHYVSSPTGASVWRFQSATQGIQILFLWVMSQLVQPMLAANLLVLLGWISTGTATYLIARHFGCRRLVAVFCALAVLFPLLSQIQAAWQWGQPPVLVHVRSTRRGHVFYKGEAVVLKLSGPGASRYIIRDYYGNTVEQGMLSSTSLAPAVREPTTIFTVPYGPSAPTARLTPLVSPAKALNSADGTSEPFS